jgi:hypothetical protein
MTRYVLAMQLYFYSVVLTPRLVYIPKPTAIY